MTDIAEELQKVDSFKEMERADLDYMLEHMERQTFAKGQVLFHAGDPGDTLYIIRSGQIRIFIHDVDGAEITFKYYGENQIFGELSPIDQRPRSASAAASEDLDTPTLNREVFLALLNHRPQIGLAMMRSLAERLRYTTHYLEESRQPAEPTAPTQPVLSRRRAQSPIAALLDKIDAPAGEEAARPTTPPPQPDAAMLAASQAPTQPNLTLREGAAYESLYARMATQPSGDGKSIFDRLAEREKGRTEKPEPDPEPPAPTA